MTLVTLYLNAHQPVRLRAYDQRPQKGPLSPEQFFEAYFDEALNRDIFNRVTDGCYLPATQSLRDLLVQHKDEAKPFKVAFGLSGTFLLQAARYRPELLDTFRAIADTGLAEFTGEPYYYTLSGLYEGDRQDFKDEVKFHADEIERLFGMHPTVLRNTECLYNNTTAVTAQSLGFDGVVTEGVDWLMEGWRSPDFVYTAANGLPILLRNYRLSDDIGYRFANHSWEFWPLSADTFAGWLARNTDMNVTLALALETFGERIPASEGIFDFLNALPAALARYPQLEWTTPTEAIQRLPRQGTILVNDFATISWADREKDTSAWLGNAMQQFAFEEMKRMAPVIRAAGNPDVTRAWRLMQTSDNLYYLSDKGMQNGNVHKYFSAYGSVYEAFVRLQTALTDLRVRAESGF